MRGDDQQQNHMFSYLSPEMRVRKDHPLRAIRAMVDEVLTQLSRRFDTMYARVGRPSIAPEKLLRAQLLQMLYSIRSERLLMEEMDYNLLFRWFVGLNADDEVWDATVFTKNRDRLLEADIATEFLARVVEQARAKGLTSDEHFTVDGTLLEAWASAKSFQPKDGKPSPPDDPGNPTVNFRGDTEDYMANTQTLIAEVYSAFNQRNIDGALALMSGSVSWPKAAEGGRGVGKEEIRAYWSRQWKEFDPHVKPIEVIDRGAGKIDVRVHQLVKSLGGDVLSESEVWHAYTTENGLIERMDLEANAEQSPSSAFS